MKKRIIISLILVILGAILFWALSYLAIGPFSPDEIEGVEIRDQQLYQELVDNDQVIVEYEVEEFVRNLFVPWSIVFTSEERLLVSERNGAIRQVVNGELLDQPVKTIPEVSTQSEEGLMGLALHPEYETNTYLYACYAYAQGSTMFGKVVRFIDQGNSFSNEVVIIDQIPAARYHAGCRLAFGPDEKLYITTGDATDKQIAQDPNSLGGKILRLNDDGSIPSDNPIANSAVYSLGHRNPQGLDWHPITNELYASEHGPSIIDGPAGGDEINLIQAGQNYGWPIVSHEASEEGLVDPLIVYTPAVAPASGMFYEGEAFPQFKNNFFVGLLRGEGIMRIVIDEDNPENIVFYEKLSGIDIGRVRDIAQGPDGFIYFSSSNKDGRGGLQEGDDKIYRLIPRY